MKRSLVFTCALITATNVSAQTQDFLNLVGGIMNQAIQNERPRARSYPSRYADEDRSYARRGQAGGDASPGKGSWTVLTVNGSMVAADSKGLTVSHDVSGMKVTIPMAKPMAANIQQASVNLVLDGQFFGTFQAAGRGSSVVIEDPNSVSMIVTSLKSRKNYEITTMNVRLTGSLTGASKAIEQIEEASAVAAPQAPNAAAGNGTTNPSGNAAALSEAESDALEKTADGVANLTAQIEMLRKVVENQQEMLTKAVPEQKLTVQATIQIINANIEQKKNDLKQADIKLQGYLTSITPNNRNQYLSARKASEIYPKVPFYIPGTTETGEFWVEPFVTDKGEQRFKFHFIDREAINDVKRDTIEIDRDQLAQIQQGLFKLYEWSEKAQAEKIRKVFSKRAICFPAADCPNDGEKGELGKSSTEVRFQIYEDGATAGRIQRNKGRFEEGYNVSIDSAMLLQAYSSFVLKESDFDYKSGTQSTKDLNEMFN